MPIGDSFFSEHPEAFGDEGGVFFVIATSIPDGCRTWQERLDTASSPDALAGSCAATFPEFFWEVLVVLRVADPGRSVGRLQLNALAWDDLVEDDNDTYVRFTRNRAHRSAAWFAGQAPDDRFFDEWISHLGTLQVRQHSPGKRLKGVFNTQVVDAGTRDTVGLVELHFDAGLCPNTLGLQ